MALCVRFQLWYPGGEVHCLVPYDVNHKTVISISGINVPSNALQM